MATRILLGALVLAALAGLVFSSVSTYDLMAHLDRQVHGIHCSLLPGLSAPDVTGSSGCHAALMSPYSSVLRERFWGGVPVSLPGMSVFAYLAFLGTLLLLQRRGRDFRAAGFLAAVTLVPVAASAVMGVIAASRVGSACRLCVGIYVASLLCFGLAAALLVRAVLASRAARQEPAEGAEPASPSRVRLGTLALWAGAGLAFLLAPLVTYLVAAPDFDRFVASCGRLTRPEPPPRVLVRLGDRVGGTPAIEVLDPLCPACLAFERRLRASRFDERLSRQALLFPLDDRCNWMVPEALHPGACALSEAVLCAGDEGARVLEWAFEQQERLLAAAREDPEAPGRLVAARFPELEGCIGSAAVRARLNLGLRWMVQNELPVLSPQLYVGGVKLCDEDTDLGLDYMLGRLVERVERGEVAAASSGPPPAAPREDR